MAEEPQGDNVSLTMAVLFIGQIVVTAVAVGVMEVRDLQDQLAQAVLQEAQDQLVQLVLLVEQDQLDQLVRAAHQVLRVQLAQPELPDRRELKAIQF